MHKLADRSPWLSALTLLLWMAGWSTLAAEDLDHRLRNAIGGEGRRTYIDEALPYLPAAALYTLDAFGPADRSDVRRQTEVLSLGFLYTQALSQGCKHIVRRRRPDGTDSHSFPSGHTATAFLTAQVLMLEYHETSAWIPVAGYTAATATAVLRVVNDRHWATDTMSGAAIGVLGAHLARWSQPWVDRMLFGDAATQRRGLLGQPRDTQPHAVLVPGYDWDTRTAGLAMRLTF